MRAKKPLRPELSLLTPQPRSLLQLWRGNIYTTWHVLLSQATAKEGRKSLVTEGHRDSCDLRPDLRKAKIEIKNEAEDIDSILSAETINTDRVKVFISE